jgi:hypothetical protein
VAREESPPQKLSLPGVGREVLTTYRSHFWPLIATAAIVFVPIALLEALTEPLREVETNDGLAVGEALGTGLLVAALSLLGEIFYSGVVAALVTARRGGRERTLGEVARELPYLRLLAVDALFALMVLGGLLLFIVPGLIVVAWFVLAGPVVELEHVGVRAAFRRSRDISRGSGLRILALMVPLLVIGDALTEAVAASGVWILGDDEIGHGLSVALSEVATAPFFGLAAVVTAHHLIEFRPRPSSPPSPVSPPPAP